MKKLITKIGTIPHLFSKIVVLWCIGFGTAVSVYALRILSRTGHDSAAVLGVILAFFGGELMVLCLKTIVGNKKNNNVFDSDTDRSDYE